MSVSYISGTRAVCHLPSSQGSEHPRPPRAYHFIWPYHIFVSDFLFATPPPPRAMLHVFVRVQSLSLALFLPCSPLISSFRKKTDPTHKFTMEETPGADLACVCRIHPPIIPLLCLHARTHTRYRFSFLCLWIRSSLHTVVGHHAATACKVRSIVLPLRPGPFQRGSFYAAAVGQSARE